LRKRIENAEILDVLLAFPAENVAHKLSGAIIHWLAGLAIDIDIRIPLEGVSTILDIRFGERNVRSTVL
jgi:hypothetical protein